MRFLSPHYYKIRFFITLTFKTRVKVNLNEQYSDFIFQENFGIYKEKYVDLDHAQEISLSISQVAKINENIIMSLTRVEKQVISNKKEILNALDLANFYYLKI